MIAAIPYWNPYSADRQQRRARERGGWPEHPTPGIEEVFHRRVLNRHETAEELRQRTAVRLDVQEASSGQALQIAGSLL